MPLNGKLAALGAAAATLALAVPATAHPGKAHHQGRPHHSAHTKKVHHRHGRGQSGSHACTPHNAAYVEGGAVDGTRPSTLAANGDGTWSGTLVVDVTRADRRARGDVGSTVTYTFVGARLTVVFAHGASGFTAGERIRLIGKIAVLAPRCAAPNPAPTPVFRIVVVHAPRSGSGADRPDA